MEIPVRAPTLVAAIKFCQAARTVLLAFFQAALGLAVATCRQVTAEPSVTLPRVLETPLGAHAVPLTAVAPQQLVLVDLFAALSAVIPNLLVLT